MAASFENSPLRVDNGSVYRRKTGLGERIDRDDENLISFKKFKQVNSMKKITYSAPSVKKAFKILYAISDASSGLGISDLAKKLKEVESRVRILPLLPKAEMVEWQTRYFEVVVPQGVQVQVLLSAPKSQNTKGLRIHARSAHRIRKDLNAK